MPIQSIEKIYSLLRSAIPSRGPTDYAALATASPAYLACVRYVILAGFSPDTHQLWINTNILTEKVAHLRHHPDAEVVLWLPRKSIQLRLRANWRVIDATLAARTPNLAALRHQSWLDQPPASKRLYLPRRRKLPDADLPPEPPPPFATLLGTLYHIDAIRLLKPPAYQHFLHTRPRNTWQSTRLKP